MPLYDYHCVTCDELFEAIRSVSSRDDSVACPSCESSDGVFMVMTGFASITTKSRWEPASNAERLAGGSVRGPGVSAPGRSAARGNVLHVCVGKSCSYCG